MSVLCYHAVDPCWTSPLAVTPEDFEVQLGWLARTRDVVPLAVALDHMDERGRLPRGMVALTFDDGFAQLEEHVFPALARHRLPATVFLVAATLTPEGQAVLDGNRPTLEAILARMAQAEAARGDGPPPALVRAREGLKLALQMRLARGPLSAEQAAAITAALEAATAAVEQA